MAPPKKNKAPARSFRSAAGRALLLVAVVIIAFVVVRWTPLNQYVDSQRLTELLDSLRKTVWAAPVLLALFVVLAPLGVPISPLIFAGGAVFGLAGGWLLNLAGSLLGAAITFIIGQRMGRDLVVHLVSADNLRRAEEILEQHGFWAIARIRLLPIPFALINYGAALAGVRLGTFLTATALGLVPSLVVYTTLSHALVSATAEDRMGVAMLGGAAILGLIALTFLPTLLRGRRQRRPGP